MRLFADSLCVVATLREQKLALYNFQSTSRSGEMSASNTQSTYGSVTKVFHWLTALLILTAIPLGVIANRLPYETSEQLTQKAWLFSAHKTVGVAVFIVALARIIWAISQPKPGLLNADKKLESFMAETAHWLLYSSLVIVPLSGWVHHAATTGFAPIWWPFGQDLPFVAKSEAIAAVSAGLHWIFTKVMAVTIFLHIAGALKHHFVDKDITLRRMWFGNVTPVPTDANHSERAPIVAALVVWCATLALGAGLGLYQPHTASTPTAELDAVDSQWEVQSGKIELRIVQFGSTVEGEFQDWTAAISFTDSQDLQKLGDVDVTISIPSLTLGSVTDQAMGADYFDASTFPEARYSADITRIPDGYMAKGTLTIKDQSQPVEFPFQLSLSDNGAEMRGDFVLQRLDFGIGDNMPDESSLGFAVEIYISLTASQTASEDS
jgi:cytochrome b561/polyisoprenoid-binding protein YceI